MKKLFIIVVLIGFLSSCSNDSETETKEIVPGEVAVGIKSGTDINDLFRFINQFDLVVDNVNSLTFTSDLPPDKLQFILANLNEKNYTNDGVNWFVTGYLSPQTNRIHIFPRLFDMNNIDYQRDWVSAMAELELHDKHNFGLNSGIIQFRVPEGQESRWKNQFENYDIVDWAELNYTVDLN